MYCYVYIEDISLGMEFG